MGSAIKNPAKSLFRIKSRHAGCAFHFLACAALPPRRVLLKTRRGGTAACPEKRNAQLASINEIRNRIDAGFSHSARIVIIIVAGI